MVKKKKKSLPVMKSRVIGAGRREARHKRNPAVFDGVEYFDQCNTPIHTIWKIQIAAIDGLEFPIGKLVVLFLGKIQDVSCAP